MRSIAADVGPVPSPDDVGPNAERYFQGHRLLAVKASKARKRAITVI